MTRRLNATALAERRYEAAKMNREGMTLAEIGEKLGVDASTVCRDMAWVREEWRKSVVEDYDQARAVELAKLNFVERCCWDAWEGRGPVQETRIEVRRLPDGGLMKKGTGTATHSGSTCTRTQDMADPVPFSSALPDGEGGATVCVANHYEEHRATPADHDQEPRAAYVCEKRVTQAGKLSHLEGVVKCINKRWKLLEALRPKESRLAPRRNSATRKSAPSDDAPRREQQAGWEGKSALQPMHCVRHAGRDGRVAAKVDSQGRKPSFMHTSRKPQCFNELQNRTNWSCSDRTFTISPIFRAKRIPAETALQVKTEMCASTRAEAPGKSGMGREIGIAAHALRSPRRSGQPRSGESR